MEVLANLLGPITSLAVSVFTAICIWKIYEKLGEPGWKSLIPFYGMYTLYKSVWEPQVYFLTLFSAVGLLVSYVFLVPLCLFACQAAMAVISVILNYKIAKYFERGIGFCIGLTLVPPVFLGILAFDDSY